MTQQQAKRRELSTPSSDEPSFYLDPFKKPLVHYHRVSAAKPPSSNHVMPSATQPYPVSIRAYNRRDYEYIASFPRSVSAEMRAIPSFFQQQKVRNSNKDSDVHSGSSGDGNTVRDESAYMSPIKAPHPTEESFNVSKSTDWFTHGQPMGELHLRLDASVSELNEQHEKCEHPEFGLNIQEHVNDTECPDTIEPLEMQRRVSLPKFGVWNSEVSSPALEGYTNVFENLREQKRGGNLPGDSFQPNLQAPAKKLAILKVPQYHPRKWISKSWSLCFVAPVTVE